MGNIVGSVILLSVLIWIPCGCFINYVDEKRLEWRRKTQYIRGGSMTSFHFQSIPNTPRFYPTTPNTRALPHHYRRTSSSSTTLQRAPWNFKGGTRNTAMAKSRPFSPPDWTPSILEN